MSRVSRKHQITIAARVLRAAKLAPGDELEVRAAGPGRLIVERTDDLVERWAGNLPEDTYPPNYLDELRDEWRT